MKKLTLPELFVVAAAGMLMPVTAQAGTPQSILPTPAADKPAAFTKAEPIDQDHLDCFNQATKGKDTVATQPNGGTTHTYAASTTGALTKVKITCTVITNVDNAGMIDGKSWASKDSAGKYSATKIWFEGTGARGTITDNFEGQDRTVNYANHKYVGYSERAGRILERRLKTNFHYTTSQPAGPRRARSEGAQYRPLTGIKGRIFRLKP